MKIITYIKPNGDPNNREDTVVFASRLLPGIDALLSPNLKGLGGITAELSTVKIVGKPGELVQNVTLPSRVISDTVSISAKSRYEVLRHRERIARLLDPSAGMGELIVENERGKYRISAIPKKNGEDVENPVSRISRVAVEFFCPNPYFRSMIHNEALVFRSNEGLVLPAEFPLTFKSDLRALTINNNSAQNAPAIITVKGKCKDFRIGIGGIWLVVPVTMSESDTLVIDSEKERVTLFRAGASIPLYPIENSVFPVLVPGINTLGVGFDICSEGVTVTLNWSPCYLGV